MANLTAEEKELLKAGMTVVRTVSSEHSVYGTSPAKIDAADVPNDVEPEIYEHLRRLPAHEVYGSVPAAAQSPVSRTPSDIDMVVPDPRATAYAIKAKFEAKGYETNITSMPRFNSYVVQVKNERGEFVDAADIHPMDGHYGSYDVHGQSLAPYHNDGLYVQRVADQLMRKSNSVLGNNRKDGGWGPAEHRQVKDTVDFVVTARTLLESKKLQAEAELKRVEKADKALDKWEAHVKTMDGYDPKKHRVGRDPIPERLEQKYIKFAQEHGDADVDDIVIGAGNTLRIVERDGGIQRVGELANPLLHVGKSRGRRAQNPYSSMDPYPRPSMNPYPKATRDPYSRSVMNPYPEDSRRVQSPYPKAVMDPYPEKSRRVQDPYSKGKKNPVDGLGQFAGIGNAFLNANGQSNFMKLGENNPFSTIKAETRGPNRAVGGLGMRLSNSFGRGSRLKQDDNLF